MKVVLVVIDAATPRVVCPAIRTGRLPVLQRLADAGTMHEASASIFPSITPAATASIVTGTYPAEHGIAGASWFDAQRDEVAYYGDDFWTIAREGFGEFIRDFLLRLNGDRLRAPTLFEMIERSGRIAACLNYLVYRGIHAHRVRIPGLIAALPGVPQAETVDGPSVLCLGDFVGRPTAHGRRLGEKHGLFHRFGMDDEATGALLRDLFAGPLPDFTLAYFADTDFRSHEVGPNGALDVVERVDMLLGQALEAAGGLERVLDDTCLLITSDHSQCELGSDGARTAVKLDGILGNYRQASLGGRWRQKDEIMICPNMRTAQIYVRDPSPDLVARIVGDALGDARTDQVIWRTGLTRPGAEGYTVATARGRLEFTRRAEGRDVAVDAFGSSWSWTGDAEALDVDIDGSTLEFGQYPNAFERIAGALDLDRSGDIWITARPGFEFQVPGGRAHTGGASHGALHALDSLSPVIVAGGPARLRLPRDLRCVDIAPLCMQLLDLRMRYSPGDPRGRQSRVTAGFY